MAIHSRRRRSRRRSSGIRFVLVAVTAICAMGCTEDPPAPPPYTAPPLERRELESLEHAVATELWNAYRSLPTRVDAATSGAEVASAIGRTGQLFHAHSQHRIAALLYQQARVRDPTTARWSYLQALAHREVGESDEARALFEKVTQLDPSHLPSYLAIGDLYLRDGDIARAEPWFDRALQLDPESAAAWVGVGRVARANHEVDRAIECFQRALALHPEATRTHHFLGLAHRDRGDRELAKRHLAQRGRIRAWPEDRYQREVDELRSGARLHIKRGTDFFQASLYSKARAEFEAAIAADDENSRAHGNLGATLKILGDLDGAHQSLERAVALDPAYALAQFNLGAVWAAKGQPPRAIPCYEAALASDPTLVQAHFNCGNAERLVGNFARAREHFEAVIAALPSNGDARVQWLLCAIRLEQHAAALARAEESVVVLPRDDRLLQILARLLATMPDGIGRDGARAVTLANGLVERESSVEHVETLAMAWAELGQFEGAVEAQQRAIAAAEAAKRHDLVRSLRRNLDRYRAQQPCRQPWEIDSPLLSPILK